VPYLLVFSADRIAIMSHGKVECNGTPLFLKKKFGTGYNVQISFVNARRERKKVLRLIQKNVPEAAIGEVNGHVVSLSFIMYWHAEHESSEKA